MPSLRVLLRMFLILVLCADGILSAQATTRMAVRHIPPPGAVNGTHSVHGGARVNERAKISNDCNKIRPDGKQAGQGDQNDHQCDCSTTSCDCSCVLTFFAGRVPVIFAAQHALTSTYLRLSCRRCDDRYPGCSDLPSANAAWSPLIGDVYARPDVA